MAEEHVAATPEKAAAASKTFTWRAGEQALQYDATAETVECLARDGAKLGDMFCLSFVVPRNPNAPRPVTFCYNGGPGSSSVPIDFGGFGPRILAESPDLAHLSTPWPVVDNPHTPLPVTDLVFMDALGTGYSTVEKGKEAEVWCVDGDAKAFAAGIAAWLTAHGRWGSPVYLMGESYGTVRNAVLVRMLQEQGVGVAGVVMVSALFDWSQTLPSNVLYYAGLLPTYAACAQWFGRAGQGEDPDEFFERACRWAGEQLAPALLLGDAVAPERERELAGQMAELVGVSEQWLLERHLRVELEDFRQELLRDEGKVVGRLDMRHWTWLDQPVQLNGDHIAAEDPADDATNSACVAAFRAFLQELGYEGPSVYLDNNYEKVNKDWRFAHQAPGVLDAGMAPNVAYDLATAMRRAPGMRVCLIGGRYDAATPWWNVEQTLANLYLPTELKANIEGHLYGCGHMAYYDADTNAVMGAMLRDWYQK